MTNPEFQIRRCAKGQEVIRIVGTNIDVFKSEEVFGITQIRSIEQLLKNSEVLKALKIGV